MALIAFFYGCETIVKHCSRTSEEKVGAVIGIFKL